MNKLITIIVDDEEDGRSTLRNFLEKYCPDVCLVAEAAYIDEAVLEINTYNPQLVFLDINMPNESGLHLFNRIPSPEFHTVFVTAYDAYALQAIKHHALDYILKPINIDELISAVNRALTLSSKSSPDYPDMQSMIQPIQRPKVPDKIPLPVLDGFVYVNVADIVRCEAEGNYTMFYFSNRNKLLVCRTIGSYEALLNNDGFIRVHHHHLINIYHIEKYQRGRGGLITMSDKAEIAVSQRRKDDFLKMIERASIS